MQHKDQRDQREAVGCPAHDAKRPFPGTNRFCLRMGELLIIDGGS